MLVVVSQLHKVSAPFCLLSVSGPQGQLLPRWMAHSPCADHQLLPCWMAHSPCTDYQLLPSWMAHNPCADCQLLPFVLCNSNLSFISSNPRAV